MPIVSCKEPDCERKVLARGICSTHYSYWHRAKNGRVDKTYSRICKFCGTNFTTSTPKTLCCSAKCGVRLLAGWSNCQEIVARLRPRVWLGASMAPRNGGALVAGQCSYCPTYFIGAPGSKYCSDRCSMNAAWKRRYDRRGEFKVTDKLRLAIYERDNYSCQLCAEPVDPELPFQDRMAATLDHIIPQSWTLIPDHSEKNLRLAHRYCNSLRGDRADAA